MQNQVTEVLSAGYYKYILLEDNTARIIKYDDYNYDERVIAINMRMLVIPDTLNGHTVTSIGNYAFSSRYCITSVTIPVSVIDIG